MHVVIRSVCLTGGFKTAVTGTVAPINRRVHVGHYLGHSSPYE